MDNTQYNKIMSYLKQLEEAVVSLPISGEQRHYEAHKIDDPTIKFTLIVNRKGHQNPDTLTFVFKSRHGIINRLDMVGTPHDNPDGQEIDTPHLHIYNDSYRQGRVAIALSNITDDYLIDDIIGALQYFMTYNNIIEVDINDQLL